MHEDLGIGNYGIRGLLAWDPKPSSHREPSLTLSQTMGVSASGCMEALLGRVTMAVIYSNDDEQEDDRQG